LIKHIGEQIEAYKKRIADIEDFLEKNDLQKFADEIKKREEEINEKSTSLRDYKEKYYKNLKLLIEAQKDF
jgi:prefoldin subunit 5